MIECISFRAVTFRLSFGHVIINSKYPYELTYYHYCQN